MEEQRMLRLKIGRARYNFLFFIILSLFNVIFICRGSDKISFPFSSSISTILSAQAMSMKAENTGGNWPLWILVASFTVILFSFACYWFSKKNPAWMLATLIFMVLDTGTLVILMVSGMSSLMTFIDLALHLLVAFYTALAVKAHLDLAKMPEYVKDPGFMPERSENDFGKNEEEIQENTDTEEPEPEVDENTIDEPIGKYEGDTEKYLVRGTYSGLNIHIIFDTTAKMIINGYICDEADIEDNFELRAIVNGIDFVFKYETDNSGDKMFLYADDELLDSLGRQRR